MGHLTYADETEQNIKSFNTALYDNVYELYTELMEYFEDELFDDEDYILKEILLCDNLIDISNLLKSKLSKFRELDESSAMLMFTEIIDTVEKCETAEEKEFYIAIASKENLSKLSLLAAIEDEKHLQIAMSEVCNTPCATVSDFIEETKVNTQQNIKKLFGTLVAICEKSIVNALQKYYNIFRKERQRNYKLVYEGF